MINQNETLFDSFLDNLSTIDSFILNILIAFIALCVILCLLHAQIALAVSMLLFVVIFIGAKILKNNH